MSSVRQFSKKKFTTKRCKKPDTNNIETRLLGEDRW